jgi:arylsulfatase
LATLRRLAIEDNTLVFFFSDNGGCAEFMAEDGWARWYPDKTPDGQVVQRGNLPQFRPGGPDTFMSYDLPWANASNTPFRLYKHWVHEGGISTPMIVQWPAAIKESRIEHAPCHVIDILPTCLQAAGVPYPAEYGGHAIQPLAGESLMPLFARTGWQRERPIFWEHEGNCAVRWGEWKLVKKYPGAWELYDMNTDRTELNDMSQRNRPVVQSLSRLYDRWAEQVGVIDWSLLEPRLRALWG